MEKKSELNEQLSVYKAFENAEMNNAAPYWLAGLLGSFGPAAQAALAGWPERPTQPARLPTSVAGLANKSGQVSWPGFSHVARAEHMDIVDFRST